MERDAKRTGRPVLIVGGSGQIGERLRRVFSAHGQTVVPTYYRNPQPGAVAMDASDRTQVMQVVEHLNPWLIVNSMNAKGGTDACESDPGLAQRAHFESARHLVDAARGVGARFVQISTDYVFDGRAGPYREEAIPAPLSQLGRAKLQAEQYALAQLPEALVLRTSFVFSWAPHAATKNLVMQLFEHDQTGSMMRVPTDQVGNVTYAPNFAQALVELVELGARGVYHVAGTTRCSKYEWALRVADFFVLNRSLIQGVSTKELGQPGPRPLESGFRLEKAQRILKRTRLMSLDESLTAMAAEMRQAEPVSA
jgi:dTDP-4-dehydrorhamnose reductase